MDYFRKRLFQSLEFYFGYGYLSRLMLDPGGFKFELFTPEYEYPKGFSTSFFVAENRNS